MPLAIEDLFGNPFVGPVLLLANFGKGGNFLRAFEVSVVTAGAVVAKKNGACLGVRRLGRAGCDDGKKKDGKNPEFHQPVLARPYAACRLRQAENRAAK